MNTWIPNFDQVEHLLPYQLALLNVEQHSIYKTNCGNNRVIGADNFPECIIDAIGREAIEKMPQYNIRYHAGDCPIGLQLIEGNPRLFEVILGTETGAIKGIDESNCVFIQFAVANPNYKHLKEEADKLGILRSGPDPFFLFSLAQLHSEKGLEMENFFHRSTTKIPTNDTRLCNYAYKIELGICKAIGEIFARSHKELTLCQGEAQIHSYRLYRKREELRYLGLNEKDVEKYTKVYEQTLLAPPKTEKELLVEQRMKKLQSLGLDGPDLMKYKRQYEQELENDASQPSASTDEWEKVEKEDHKQQP